jgi:hypothetical protein
LVLDEALKAIAHFLVRAENVHTPAVGKDDLGHVGATVRSLYLHDVSHVEQCGAELVSNSMNIFALLQPESATQWERRGIYSIVAQITKTQSVQLAKRHRVTHGSNMFSCCDCIGAHPLAIRLTNLSH